RRRSRPPLLSRVLGRGRPGSAPDPAPRSVEPPLPPPSAPPPIVPMWAQTQRCSVRPALAIVRLEHEPRGLLLPEPAEKRLAVLGEPLGFVAIRLPAQPPHLHRHHGADE